jgi:hypothetical protein
MMFDCRCYNYNCLYQMNSMCTNKFDDIVPYNRMAVKQNLCPKETYAEESV